MLPGFVIFRFGSYVCLHLSTMFFQPSLLLTYTSDFLVQRGIVSVISLPLAKLQP